MNENVVLKASFGFSKEIVKTDRHLSVEKEGICSC